MTWHYLPVYKLDEETGDRIFSLCEVYLDDRGRLEHWTVKPDIAPIGDSHYDLVGTCLMMARDAHQYRACRFDLLRVGMKFTRQDDELATVEPYQEDEE